MKKQVFQVTKTNDGIDLSKVIGAFDFLRNGNYIVTISKPESKRSIQQNKLFWLLMNCLSDNLGGTPQEMHDYVCTNLCKRTITLETQNGEPITREVTTNTSKLTQKEFSELIDKIYALGTEMNINMAKPEDERFSIFEEMYN